MLSKLASDDAQKLMEIDALISTYDSLLLNQFINEAERLDIISKNKVARENRTQLMKRISKKYSLPFIVGKCYVSPETKELYTYIYNE